MRLIERNFAAVVLSLFLAFIAVVLVSGTVVAFLGGGPAYQKVKTQAEFHSLFTDQAIYGEIGLLRARTSDAKQVLVIVSPSFPYPEGDSPFREELFLKKQALSSGISDWFAASSKRDLEELGEAGVKREILRVANEILVLGDLTEVYFEVYQILD